MDLPVATVVRADDRIAVVRVDDAPACARCAAGKGCGAGLLAGRARRREFALASPPRLGLRAGDRVCLTLAPARLLRASLLGYGLPLAMLVLLPLAADTLWGPISDATLALSGAVGLAAAVFAGRRLLARERCLDRLVPAIAGRAGSAAPDS